MAIDQAPQQALRDVARQAMLKRGFLPDFSAEALRQAQSRPSTITQGDSTIRDLREWLWSSIDNDDSRDLDQLTVAQAVDNGSVKIWVAIADVDSVVSAASPIDDHAQANTTSVYTAAGIFPMLPERLSTDLTSLIESAERLAVVIEMTVTPEGSLAQSDIFRARVLNHAKLAYRTVAAWLDGAAPAPEKVTAVKGMDEQLRMQDGVAQLLRRSRHERGALDLETSQSRPVFTQGLLSDFQDDRKNRAQELIEDFMIAANGVCARYLEQKGFPVLRRVLRAPARWDRIVALAAQVNEKLPASPDALALDAFLARRRAAEPERFADLSLSIIKLLGAGEYSVELPGERAAGHFGLAVRDYTHSTAPNRRFPDLVTQRLLKAAVAGTPSPYSEADLHAIAAHCTEQENNASKVEREVLKSAAASLLASRVGQRFQAIVTGASAKGTWVRILHPTAEGRVVRGFEGLDVGDRIAVTLVNTDIPRGFIDFALAK